MTSSALQLKVAARGLVRTAALIGCALTACVSPPGSVARDGAVADAVPKRRPDAAPTTVADLVLDPARTKIDFAMEQRRFDADACELDPVENCVGAPGVRSLLRFSIETPNVGTADLVLGPPREDNPNFEFSPCHGHYHFLGYAEYQLVDGAGAEVAMGNKQAFCLVDTQKYVTSDPTVSDDARYTCADQGIQRGWSDVYHAALPCQWIDVTDVPPGDYTLRVTLNSERTLPELDYDNNVTDIPVTLGDARIGTPTEPCPAALPSRVQSGDHRECGWALAGTLECDPGRAIRVGCAAACGGLGSCTGDAMMRVCDAARPDGNCSFAGNLGAADDACGSSCPQVADIQCPASGKVDVYSAPHAAGEAYTCNAELAYQE